MSQFRHQIVYNGDVRARLQRSSHSTKGWQSGLAMIYLPQPVAEGVDVAVYHRRQVTFCLGQSDRHRWHTVIHGQSTENLRVWVFGHPVKHAGIKTMSPGSCQRGAVGSRYGINHCRGYMHTGLQLCVMRKNTKRDLTGQTPPSPPQHSPSSTNLRSVEQQAQKIRCRTWFSFFLQRCMGCCRKKTICVYSIWYPATVAE